MLKSFLEMKDLVNKFLDSASNRLAAYILSNEEWEAVDGLVFILMILKDATEFVSSNSPNIPAIIPAMDQIDEAFATRIVNEQELSASLQHALSTGKQTLNKYYQLTDTSHIYQIAMILHPSFKLEYFKMTAVASRLDQQCY
ncbi:hypothetical protein BT96DRAFT_547167 [Gymnopus androsaceus JB14]|uniref:hAT-like transposase RNase-H fold domain-containing protein n=1 Tax=Gymnopus androsaceus JB14 TaxID=1447944 RepID=A0A6A4HXB4_9AGAR|nr:hypothetical protein BT96DRAFT_547167 [Gymnopus androsaceus JB14]